MLKNKEIAKLAGVSPATVSLVLNNKKGVSQATRKKVLDIVRQMNADKNYPKKSIRFLKYKKHGLVVDDNGFISSLIDGVDIGARKYGYDVIITTIYQKNKDAIIEMVKKDPRDGIILLGTELNHQDIQFLKHIDVPVLIVDSYFEFENYDCVVMNNIDATYMAVKYLYDKGFREIGHFESSVIINNFTARKEGYLKALKALGLEFNPKYTFKLESTLEGSYRDMKKILSSNPKLPPAVFSDNDTIAVGALKALKEHGVKIPDDIAIIGFDDIPFCEMVDPPLSTIRILKEEIGSIASKRLIEKIEKNDKKVLKIEVGAELIERKST